MTRLHADALKGSFPPLVTPFLDDGGVDFDTFAKLVERQCVEGSHGVVVTGTTGEPSTLSVEERLEMTRVAVEVARGRIQIVAATGSQSHHETVRLSQGAASLGVDALLIVTPYFVRPPQRGLSAYFTDLSTRVEIPVMIYHIPGRAGVEMTPVTIEAAVEAAPNIIGVKHASTDLGFVTEILSRLGMDFRIHVGLEDLSFPMLAIGAHGLMNAVGNLAPRRVSTLYTAVRDGDLATARRLHFDLHALNQSVFFDTNPIPMKYMMMRMGLLPNEAHRLPMAPSTPELRARLDPVLDAAGLLASV